MSQLGHQRTKSDVHLTSALPLITDSARTLRHVGYVSRVDGALARAFLTSLQSWSGAVTCPACLCGREAAGHNALRGSGPNQKHALESALTHTGSPDSCNDLVCITSSVLANSFKLQTPSLLPGLTFL
jgi:hypothetical protein